MRRFFFAGMIMQLVIQKTEKLVEMAQELGIDTRDLDRQQLIEEIQKHESGKVPEADAPPAGAVAASSLQDPAEAGTEAEGSSGLSRPSAVSNQLPSRTERCWFRVAAGQRADEKGPVFAAINGESILIHRNSWVQLPVKFLPVFEDALTSEVVILEGGKSMVRDMPRFNYEVRSLSEGKPREQRVPAGF